MKDKQKKSGTAKPDFIEPHEEKQIKKDFKYNPFEKYQHTFRSSFITLFLGIVLGIFGFVLLGYSEGINKQVNTLSRLPLIEAQDIKKTSGIVKITGVPVAECDITVPLCQENLLYYKTTIEELRNNEWVHIRTDEAIANFSLGDILIIPDKAKYVFDLKEESQIQEPEGYKKTINGVINTEKLIVIGELKEGKIRDGEVFLITNKNDKDLVSLYKDEAGFDWWYYKLAALILLTLGLTAFIIPVLSFLDIFENLGWIASGVVLILSLIISLIVVFLTTIILTFWWLIILLVGILLIMMIRIKRKKEPEQISFIP